MARTKQSAAPAKERTPSRKVTSATPAPLFIQRKAGCACGGGCPRCQAEDEQPRIQRKLVVGPVNDAYEREADAIANNGTATIRRLPQSSASASAGAPVPASVEHTLSSPGRPLDGTVRMAAERRLGHDLSGVRIHDDPRAAQSAGDVNAQAYTAGRHVVFGAGRYQPRSAEGKRLILHELVHVVQQNGAPKSVQRTVRESVVSKQLPGAQACVLHLHGNEENAREVAVGLSSTHCVNYLDLTNKDRWINVDLPGGSTCLADPNRIFTAKGIKSHSVQGGCSDTKTAQTELISWRDGTLMPAIKKCRAGSDPDAPLPVVAMHNNSGLSIDDYLPGGSEAGAAETDKKRLGGLKNPAVPLPKEKQSYLLTTSTADFKTLGATRNTVLQSTTPTDDGSLSVFFAGERYVNVETFGKKFKGKKDPFFLTDQAMALDVMTALGVGKQPCPVPKSPATTTTPAPDSIQRKPGDEESEDPGEFNYELWRLVERLYRFVRDWWRRPSAMPLETWTIPGCTTFQDQAGLDTEKAKWAAVIAGMPAASVIQWIIGVNKPPSAVAKEVMSQLDCLRAAARKAGTAHGFFVPAKDDPSEYRSFASQESIWMRKFKFDKPAKPSKTKPGANAFDRISFAARQSCPSLPAADRRWDPEDPAHEACWKKLSDAQKQQEILQASSAPGISRHHYGTDVDVFNRNTDLDPDVWQSGGKLGDVYAWLRGNASTYGFIQSFTTFSALTGGYMEERWHWSYYPVAQALLEFAKTNQADIEKELFAKWGSKAEFSWVRRNWRKFVFNVNEKGF